MADTNIKILADREDIVAVADAVRAKTGTTAALTLGGMVTAIEGISVGSDPVLQDKTVTPTTSKQTITADSGYDGLDTVTVNAMPPATQATPSISVNSSGLITASATQTAGYVAAGTKSATKQLTTQAAKTITPSTSSQTAVASGRYTTGAVTVAAIPSTYVKPTATKAAATYTPSTSNQTIAAGTYLSGAQTIKGDANLTAANIAEGVSIFGVTGTHSAGGSDPFENTAPFTYTVNPISGASYGFALNSNGYYESQNKGQNSTYAICRVNLVVKTACDITFDVINYAESNYDYALFSNLDTSLNLNNSADTSNVKKNFKGLQSPSVVNVIYENVSIGNHTIDIKFIKDTSQHNNNDSVQFKIQEQGGLSQETINKILAADTDLVAENIKSGVDIFGVVGNYTGGGSGGGDTSVEDAFITRTLTSYTNDRVETIGSYAFYSCLRLTTVSFPAVKTIGSNAFHNCFNLTTVSFPVATTIGNSAFRYCSELTTVSFPAATTIISNAFVNCSKLTTVSFPAATTIGNYAFYSCSKLTTVSFPAATTISNNAFADCSNLTTVSFPAATTIGDGAFGNCRNLTAVSFPVATTIGDRAFGNCRNLTAVSFPVATTIGSYAFSGCAELATASFPVATTIDSYTFSGCTELATASFPVATTIGSYAFSGCIKLATASFPKATSIGANAFYNCYNLKSLYLTSSSLCQLAKSNAFASTPIGGYSTSARTYGSIYVPASLLASYKAATNWTYFSSRFVGI